MIQAINGKEKPAVSKRHTLNVTPIALTVVLVAGITLASISNAATPKLHGTVTIYAASSLTNTYINLANTFKKTNPGVKIIFSFGSSSTLATQINSGAPADIFVSADIANMAKVGAEFSKPVNYVLNKVVMAVPTQSPIHSEKDFALQTIGNLKWLQCVHTAPCGSAADAAIASDGLIFTNPVSLESSDASALAKLLAGSVDAAIIYKTDVTANATQLRAVDFADTAAASSQYQIALKDGSSKKPLARAVFAYFNGARVRTYLVAHGFIASGK